MLLYAIHLYYVGNSFIKSSKVNDETKRLGFYLYRGKDLFSTWKKQNVKKLKKPFAKKKLIYFDATSDFFPLNC